MRRVMITLLAVALPLVLAPAASARIDVQTGIAKIELEDTAAEVIAEKGRPDADRIIPSEILGEQRKMRYGKTKVFFAGTDDSATVIALVTKSRGQRTNRGVGVGSLEADVVANVRNVRCRTEFGFRHCFRGRFRPGRRVTDFTISEATDRVTRVTVAFVID